MSGGRGSGADRRSRDFGRDRDRAGNRNGLNKSSSSSDAFIGSYVETKRKNSQATDYSGNVPKLITNVAPPKGAWGQNSNQYVGTSSSTHDKDASTTSEVRADMGSVAARDPTPAGFLDSKSMKPLDTILSTSEDGFAPMASTRTPATTTTPSTGNVWATKGSAHLIQQECAKQKQPVSRHIAGGEGKTRRDHGNNRNNENNKISQSQTHHEQDLITDTVTLLASVNNDPVVVHDVSDVANNSNDSHTANLQTSLPTPSDALDATLDSLLPSTVQGSTVSTSGWSPHTEPEVPTSAKISEITRPSGTTPIALDTPVTEPVVEPEEDNLLQDIVNPSVDLSIAITEADKPVAPPVSELPTSTVLLGAWDVSGDETGLDFGFGSFGNDNDVASVEEKHIESSQSMSAHATDISATPAPTATMSPARPPPGLSIGGMPPMPTNAVSVHELEGKLEAVALGVTPSQNHAEDSPTVDVSTGPPPLNTSNGVGSSLTDKSVVSNDLTESSQGFQPQQPQLVSASTPDSANPMLANQSYGAAYGMGIYPNVGSGFMGIHAPNAPVLGGVLHQQPKLPQHATNSNQQQGGTQTGLPQHLHQAQQPQGGSYGTPASNVNVGVSGGSDGPTNGSGDTPSSAGIPPGIPGAMPYNPALFYGQQYYQMGQHHGGVGYGHAGYGQFGAGVQSGFGYQQVMGQSGGYGQPYDDTPQQHHGSHNSHHNSNSHQSYQKNNHGANGTGGYRGRSNHHSNNHHGSHNNGGHQYQNQYNPQHGGYGGPSYNMGYSVDQFGNRGGYVPGSMDPYNMQQSNTGYQSSNGHSAGGFNQDDSDHQLAHSKGKSKGGNSRVNNTGFVTGNPNVQQYQQIPPQQVGQSQQQGFGFQGGASETSSGVSAGTSSNGWSNQGWAGSTWQGGN